MPLSVGDKLGPYEIVAPIGAGGMGEVYRAHDSRLGRDVAIKICAQEFTNRFEREARAIAALNHPHICTLYDIGPNYLVMEFIEGVSPAGPLPLDVVLRHASQIADALNAAHAKGIIHRDLKPANILATASGIKLLDFGLALATQTACEADSEATLLKTQAGTILGTAAYMSPEQVEGKPADARSDIFSFGIVLYEMASGRRAFTGDSRMALLAAILRDQPQPLPAHPELQDIVTRCLRKSPADRFQSMAQVKEALQALTSPTPSSRTNPSGTPAAVELAPSVAVLPFASLSRDEDNDYFSDALSEEIINLLARIPALKVIARTSAFSFRGKDIDIRKIGGILGVRTILEGSVRRAGNRLRVTAQLVNAADGSHLWSDRYDRELSDVFALQDEIAGSIAQALTIRLAVQSDASRRHTPVLAAYEAVLRARHHLGRATPESMERARECLRQAIATDPQYALPHCVLGGSFIAPSSYGLIPAHEAMPLARAEYQKALEIDPMLPEALVGLATISMVYHYNWNEAEQLFAKAISSGPLQGGARMRYAHFLYCTGRPEAALNEHEGAVQGDPLNVQLRSILALALMMLGRNAESARECRRILELDENYHLAHFYLALALQQLGQADQALASAEKAHSLAPWARPSAGYFAGALKHSGETGRAEALLNTLDDGSPGAPLGFLFYHLGASEIGPAATWAAQTIEQRQPAILYYLMLPLATPLRLSPHWPALAAMMNLPQASGTTLMFPA